MSHPFILHATPPLRDLPASDPEALYLAALLQLVVPGRWAIQTGDYSANGGKLPYITHLGHFVRTRHLSSLPSWTEVDEDKSEAGIWTAYIEQSLTDLVNHTLYSLPPNYTLLAPAQSGPLGPLERHYIPQRIRAIHKTRLEHVGLWGLGGSTDVEEPKEGKEAAVAPGGTEIPRGWAGWGAGREVERRRRAWEGEQLAKRARGVLDVLSRRVGEGYFGGERPGTPDLFLFAHLTLLLTPGWPNPLLADLLRTSYPRLVAHHDRIQSLLFPDGTDSIQRISPPAAASWIDTLSSWTAIGGDKGEKKKSDTEKRFERGRWAWFAGAGVAMVGYLLVSGVVRLEFGDGEESEDGEEDDGDQGEILIVEDEDSDDE